MQSFDLIGFSKLLRFKIKSNKVSLHGIAIDIELARNLSHITV